MNIKECHVILDQSQRRISYVHLCKNTKFIYSCSAQLISFEVDSISKEINCAEHEYMNMSPPPTYRAGAATVSVPNVQYMFKNLMCMFEYLKTPVVTIFPGGSQKLDWTQNFDPHGN